MLICVLPAVVIVGRLWSLQVDPNSHHLFRIRAEHAKLVRVPPRRGVVLDRNDRVIATNRPVFNLHFVYRHLNPRYIVIEVLCEELGRLGDFPLTHDVQAHLRTLAFEHADAEELLLVEEIPSSAALGIQRRLRHLPIYRQGFTLRRSTLGAPGRPLSEEEEADDSARYELVCRPGEVLRMEQTLARLALQLPECSFETLGTSIDETLSTIDRWVDRFVRRDREAGVEEAIWESKARNARRAYFDESWPLVRDVGLDVVTQIEYHPELFPGLEVVDTSLRHYPLGEAAGTLLGHLGRLNDRHLAQLESEGRLLDLWTHVRSVEAFAVIRERGLRRTDSIGTSGLERFYDERLRGKYGMRVVQVDSLMREHAVLAALPTEDGAPLRTTLDIDLQTLLYSAIRNRAEALGAVAGSAVVLAVPSGEILASVGFPSIDPNRLRERGYTAEVNRRWKDMKPGGWIDRPFYHALDPGSIFKVVTAIAALESGHEWEGPVDALRSFDCVSGVNRPFKQRCASRWGHGPINLYEAFKFSCNNYFYYLGAKHLEAASFDRWARAFGFGSSPCVDLPHRAGAYDSGYLRPVAEIRSERDLCSYAIGQSHVRATPMQIARLMAAVAVECEFLPTPHLRRGKATPVPLPLQNRRNAKVIVESMRRVVSEVGGTVHGKSELERFRFAAKTGTAQFRTGVKRYHSWLVGFGPLPRPSMAFAIVLEESPLGGGASCAPVARELLDWLAERDPRYLVDPESSR